MPGIYNPASMAECLNRGLGLARKDDLKQAVPGVPVSADIMFNDLCHQDGNHDFLSLPHNNQKNRSSPSSSTSEEELFAQAIDLPKDCDTKMQSDNEKTKNVCPKSNDLSETDIEIDKVVIENLSVRPKVPYNDSSIYFLPVNYNQRNPWRRMVSMHASGNILKNSTYPLKSRNVKQRFAQAKKPLSYLYSYFSVEILEFEKGSIAIGLSRKDYPNKIAPGKSAGSVGYCSDSGIISVRDIAVLSGPEYSKGDIIGCGIVYPLHYKHYADLSSDDSSDGMTDVILSSLLNVNKKSMDFVKDILNLTTKRNKFLSESNSSGEESDSEKREWEIPDVTKDHCDYYNENYVESRTQVEVYFTHNMNVIGKVLSYVPIGGFYPTLHILSSCALKMSVDLNPPTS